MTQRTGHDRAAGSRLTRRDLVTAAVGGASAAAADRLRRGHPAFAAARDTLVMAPSYVIRSLDPGHTLEPLGETICHAAYDALVTLAGEDLSTPQPSIIPILSNGALGVVDSKAAIAQGADAGPDAKDRDHAEGYLNAHSLGSGAFILESHTPNQEVVLVRNPRHWRGAPSIARVVIRNIPEASTQALGLERGDLDIATGLGLANAQTLGRVPSVTVKNSLIAASFRTFRCLRRRCRGATVRICAA